VLETHSTTRELVIDLRIQFYIPKDFDLSNVVEKLDFYVVDLPEHPRFFPETLQVDFESDYAEDKPGFMAPMEEMNGTDYYPSSNEIFEIFESAVDKCSGNPDYEEWFLFCRVLVEMDTEYEWDFDDEERLDDFFEEIQLPLFNSMRLSFGDLDVINYSLDLSPETP
jgi:hypothetical protein